MIQIEQMSLEAISRRLGVEAEVLKQLIVKAAEQSESVDNELLEAWKQSAEWEDDVPEDGPQVGELAEPPSHGQLQPASRPALLPAEKLTRKEELECQVLQRESEKLAAEAAKVAAEAQQMELKWWQKPRILLPVAIPVCGLIGSAFAWGMQLYLEVNRDQVRREVVQLKDDLKVLSEKELALRKIAESQGRLEVRGMGGEQGDLRYSVIFDYFDPTLAASASQEFPLEDVSGHLSRLGIVHRVSIDANWYVVNPETFQWLGGLNELRTLRLTGDKFDSRNFIELRRAQNLETVDLDGALIQPGDLEFIGKLRQIENLNLKGTDIDDRSLAHLSNLDSLKTLTLARTPITSDGVRELQHLHNLRWLDLSNTDIDEKAIEFLRECKFLTTVTVPGSLRPAIESSQQDTDGKLQIYFN